jgi:hypothetical protein
MEITGGCLCRAVRYRISAVPSWACINPDLPRVAAQPPPIG